MSISLILSFKKLTFALITLKIIKNNIITLKVIAYLYFSTYIMCVEELVHSFYHVSPRD